MKLAPWPGLDLASRVRVQLHEDAVRRLLNSGMIGSLLEQRCDLVVMMFDLHWAWLYQLILFYPEKTVLWAHSWIR